MLTRGLAIQVGEDMHIPYFSGRRIETDCTNCNLLTCLKGSG